MMDGFDKNLDDIKTKKLYLLDLDGTLYNDNFLFDGTLEFLNAIKEIGGKYIFITNNSSRSMKDHAKKLNKLGIPATEDDFCSSSLATSIFINKNYSKKKCFCVGTESFKKELEEAGIEIVNKENAEVVVIGYDIELNYQKLIDICEVLSTRDIPFIATNPDLVCPVNFGFVPDCGLFCHMIEVATGKKPIYIGKPNPTLIEMAIASTNFSKEKTVVIGDRLYTDIASGINAGVTTVCVLSGETKKEDLVESSFKPTYVLNDISEITKKIRNDK